MKVVYNSFNGRYSDSPRAIYEALVARGGTERHVWLQDVQHEASFPAGLTTVPIGSPDAVAALGSADVVVSNTHVQLDVWDKKPGTVYLQTWHGTPLKRIHRSAVSQPPAELMAELDADIARWDYLVTPSPAGTRLLRDAFGYPGTVLETGYPRNDVLSAHDRDERREKLRTELDLPAGTVAVLYAPTWRDDTIDDPDAPLGLDPASLLRGLGPGHVLLLRRHYYLSQQQPYVGEDVRDVSLYPEIADLYLAADVLVTDYSSAMFDFVVTGKPVLLYLYDLEHYRDEVRGLTLDLLDEAPGPLLRDQAALVQAIRALPAVDLPPGQYAEFRRRYTDLEDGHATTRVVDAVFGPAG